MRKITEQAANAFMNAKKFKSGNTTVDVLLNVTVLSLHGNEIAYRYNDPENTLSITNAGWESNTTKERLNGMLEVLDLPYKIVQRNFKWIIQKYQCDPLLIVKETLWDGKLIDVKK